MLACLVGRDRGWSLRSTPGLFQPPLPGWACRDRVGVARGGRSGSGERRGGSSWWPVEASPFRAEALGGTGSQGRRGATNPGLGKNFPSGHAWAGEQACQSVREHGEDQRHDELSEGRQQEMGKAGSFAAACDLDSQTWRSVATGGLGDRRMSLQDMAGPGAVAGNGPREGNTTPRTLCPW
jgi:hypothetical protein